MKKYNKLKKDREGEKREEIGHFALDFDLKKLCTPLADQALISKYFLSNIAFIYPKNLNNFLTDCYCFLRFWTIAKKKSLDPQDILFANGFCALLLLAVKFSRSGEIEKLTLTQYNNKKELLSKTGAKNNILSFNDLFHFLL